MGAAPKVRDLLTEALSALEREESQHLREALTRALPYVARAMSRANSIQSFNRARSDHRFICAALGMEHE